MKGGSSIEFFLVDLNYYLVELTELGFLALKLLALIFDVIDVCSPTNVHISSPYDGQQKTIKTVKWNKT